MNLLLAIDDVIIIDNCWLNFHKSVSAICVVSDGAFFQRVVIQRVFR